MAFVHDHSANLPTTFVACGRCGKKGAFFASAKDVENVSVRCKYCGAFKVLERGTVLDLTTEGKLLAYRD